MLSAGARVVIVNRSAEDGDLKVVAAGIVRHDSTGPMLQILSDLDLGADKSEWVDPPAPMTEPLVMIEVLLQLGLSDEIVDAYLCTTPTDPPPARGWEAGVRPLRTPTDPTDIPIPELPGYAVYLVPF
jgi:hypothetical protein